jgi:hypothetical protein
MSPEILWYVLAGFLAQLVDGALGMAFGVVASSILLSVGLPPAVVAATSQAAKFFTCGASAASHHAFGNIDGKIFRRLLLPAMLGAIIGAYLLTRFPADQLKPWVAGYLLLMGAIIVGKAFREIAFRRVTTHLMPLGFFGAVLDAMGGGGWGPIVTSNLLARGNPFHLTVGSVNAVEFFVAVSASIVFVLALGVSHWQVVAGLAAGGILAAPLGAWLVKHVPIKPMMVFVGLLVIGLSLRTLLKHFGVL